MGFNSVYRCLVEIFPKVDSRLLRAVAIEHPKDAYQAVDVVLKEIIPYLSSWSNTLTNPTNDDKVESGEQMDLLRQQQLIEKPGKGPSSEPQLINGGAAKETDHTGGVIHADATPLAEEQMDLLSKQKASDKQEAGPSLEPQPVDGEATKEMDHTGDYLHIDATPLVEELVELLSQQHVSDEPEERQSSQSQPQPQPQPIHGQAAKETDHTDGVLPADATPLVEALNESEVSDFYDASDSNDQSCAHTENEEVILLGKTEENSVEVGMNQSEHSTSNNQKWICENTEGEYSSSLESAQENRIKIGPEVTSPGMGTSPIEELHVDVQANRQHEQVFPSRHFDHLRFDDFDGLLHGEGHETELFSDSTEVRNPVALVYTSSIKGHFPAGGGSSDVDFKQEYSASEMSDIEDEPKRDTQVTRSWEKIDLLEEIIEDAKNNKKTLFSAMERVINMMREVELQEKAAEQAKLEASRGGLDILIKVEEMKEMMAGAKEANNMHAGEVYGEKAILATEVRELQSRLLSLSDERDKSLAILDEIHQALEGRLATAEELRKAAEKERFEKEESARSAFAEQEAIMEKIIQETKILEQEAEENSKLREFLTDRGHVVDILQGEISVICQDVRLLKEKFDDHVPLSKSVSSSQTSCILATSGSSVKSTASDLAAERSLASSGSSLGGVVAVLVPEEGEALKTPKKTSPSSSVQSVSPRSRVQRETARADKELLLDDEWDLFDPDAEFDI